MVAGLEDISEGVLTIGDRVVNHVPSRDRDIAMVFQSYALYPHLSVYENIAFGLKLKKMPKEEIQKRVQDAARILGLEPFLKRKPRALSGGQRQRVAMGRAIVRQPSGFLMDEPLSNLDAKLRVQMRAEIAGLQRDLGVTTIYVTHDQVEAMTMGDRVAVMRKGELQQVADPQTLYDRPVNLFVAGFIGSPAMNMLEATLEPQDGGIVARFGSQSIALGDETLSAHPALTALRGQADRARHPARGPRGRRARAPTAPATAAPGHGRADRGARLGDHGALPIEAKPAVTEDVRELAEDVGDDRAVEQLEERRRDATLVGRFGARSRVRSGRAGRGRRRHARPPLFRPRHRARHLRRRGNRTKGAA